MAGPGSDRAVGDVNTKVTGQILLYKPQIAGRRLVRDAIPLNRRVCIIATFSRYALHNERGVVDMRHWNNRESVPASSGIQDAQDIAAALLLSRVEAMLREGQPRHAVAHICDMTGVDRTEAEAFVAHLKAELFSA